MWSGSNAPALRSEDEAARRAPRCARKLGKFSRGVKWSAQFVGVPAGCQTGGGLIGGVTARRAWVIDLRRLGCGCGRRLVTGSCVIRETIQTGCPWSRPRVSIYLSIIALRSAASDLTSPPGLKRVSSALT